MGRRATPCHTDHGRHPDRRTGTDYLVVSAAHEATGPDADDDERQNAER
jgi:hypothetical protein